jgi:plastocyanin domain-containing protein
MKPFDWLVVGLMGAAVAGCSQSLPSDPRSVQLTVSESGFAPLEVSARQGVPLTLLVTRVSEASCAREIIIPEAGVRRSLPVREEVGITFTPERRGEMRYTCCEDMVGGKIVVR